MLVIPMKFVLGAAVGACSTYLYKDDKAREWARSTAGKLKSGFGSLLSRKKTTEEISQEATEPVVEVTPDAGVTEVVTAK